MRKPFERDWTGLELNAVCSVLCFLLAFWRILSKLIRPNNLNLIRFVDKKTIKQHINQEELLAHMGGSVSGFV